MIVGYTTGVFDMFHIGHLNILRHAKELCDFLIVGVSTDELVRDYKKKSPVIPFEERFEIVKAIRYVNQVVPQRTLDKSSAWNDLHFNILFHGSDWKGSNMYQKIESEMNVLGVKVVYLPHTEGISTTLLEEFVKKHMEDK